MDALLCFARMCATPVRRTQTPPRRYPAAREYTSLARMDPHLILYIFMPTLIFESAFAMDVHTFKKMTSQIVVLAFPGMMLGAVRNLSDATHLHHTERV